MINRLLILFLSLTISATLSAQIKEFALTCDPANFQLIYDNYEQDIYVPATFNYDGTTWSNVSIRIRGDGSRAFPKKSLKVRFNEGEYIDGRSSLNLNAEWEDQTYIQQFIASRLMRESGQTCFNSEHVRVMLNGDFLGLYLLVEAVDERFYESRGMDTLGNTYKAALDGSSLSVYDDPEYHWEQKTGVDINMADLQILIDNLNDEPQASYSDFVNARFNRSEAVNILAMNTLLSLGSTYYHNYFMYHEPTTDKWSMLPWDMDKTLSYYGSNFPYHRSSTIWMPDNPFLEKAIQSESLLSEIRQRMVDLDASIFNLSHITPILDSIQNAIQASVAEDVTDDVSDIGLWQTKVNDYKNIFGQRVNNTLTQIDEYPRNFTIERVGSAAPNSTVTLHWTPSESPLQRPITYRFFLADALDIENNAIITIDNITDTLVQFAAPSVEATYYYKVQAYDGFTHVDGFDTYNPIVITDNVPDLVINEINYNSSINHGVGDWVEIYNPQTYSVALEGWKIRDNQNDNVYQFEAGVEIPADGFIVVCRIQADFQALVPTVINIIGDIPFGFGNSGDRVRLYHPSGLLVDEVQYSDAAPWPADADGLGPTLELLSPELDNMLPENWAAWPDRLGTPGDHNYNETGIAVESNLGYMRAFPNPNSSNVFNLIVSCQLTEPATISLIDKLGRIVFHTTVKLHSGESRFELKPNLHSAGVYLLRVESSSLRSTQRIIFTNTN